MVAVFFPYVCVIALQFLLLYPLHTTMDLPTWDEAIYLGQGAYFFYGDTLGPISFSPVYSLLYSLMIKLFGTVHSFFYMQYFVKVAVSALLLLSLAEHLRSRLLALLLTLLWVASGVNIFESVLVYHVALGFFLLALFSLNKHRGIALLLMVLASLTRLEYLFPTLAFAGYLTFTEGFRLKSNRSESVARKVRITAPVFVAVLLSLLVLYVVINVDDLNPGTNRTWFAFNQKYARHEVESGRYQLNPFLDYNLIVQNDFPGAESLLSALATNPNLFLIHVVRNIAMLPIAILSFGIPYIGLKMWGLLYGLLLGFTVAIVMQAAVLNWRLLFSGLLRVIRERNDILYVTLVGMLSLIPILFVYPLPHHTQIMVPLVLLWVGLAGLQILKIIDFPQFARWSLGVLNGLFILAIMVTPKPYAAKQAERANYDKVIKLIELLPKDKIKLMAVGASWYASYIGVDKVEAIEPLATTSGKKIENGGSDLRWLLEKHHPDAVLINDELVSSKNFKIDSLAVLNSNRWVEYPLGADSIYFRKEKFNHTRENR
jgi:hypothetical protein